MTTIVRSFNMIRTGKWRGALRDWFVQKIAEQIGWLLSQRAVQQHIVNAIEGGTPLCSLIDAAVDNRMDKGLEIDTSDISHLDSYVEDAIGEYMRSNPVDADDVEDLGEYVERAVSDALEEKSSEIADEVCKTIAERIRG